jgi:hypothetical protein
MALLPMLLRLPMLPLLLLRPALLRRQPLAAARACVAAVLREGWTWSLLFRFRPIDSDSKPNVKALL